MDSNTVQNLVSGTIEDAEVLVEGAGANYDITVVSDIFAGMRAVGRQQAVYAALSDAIAEGTIHAVNIRAYTPTEWEERGA